VTLRVDASKFVDEHLLWAGRSPATREGYAKDLRYFADYMERRYNGQVFTDEVTEEDVETYLHYLRAEKQLSLRTVGRYLSSLRSFYKYACRRRLTVNDPTALIKAPKVPRTLPVYLDEEELTSLARAAQNPTIESIIWTLYLSGLRNGELCSLKLADVDLGRRLVYVRRGKGSKDRVVPTSSRLAKVLETYLRWYRHDGKTAYFFTTRSGRICTSYVTKCIKEAAQKAGIQKKVSAHTLRHSFATALYRKGVGILEISVLLGHESVETTQVYTHLAGGELQKAVEVL